jgi:MFS family permease
LTAETGQRPAESGIAWLLHDPNYLCIWALGGLTGFIRWFQLLALGVFTFEITGSPLLVALVPILWGMPLALCGPIIGALADRFNRKLILGGSLLVVLTVAVVMIVLAYTDSLAFVHIAIASLVSGLFWATDMPVRRRLVGDTAGENLSAAMSLDSATNSATRMLGPFMGGVVLQLIGITGIYALSATVYIVCLGLVVAFRLPDQVRTTGGPALIADLIAGARYIVGDWHLRRVFAITIVFNVWGFPFTSMIPILGKERLALEPLSVGLLSSLEGFGAFVGAMAIAFLARPEYFARIYIGSCLLYVIMIMYLGVLAAVAGGPNHSFIAVSMTLMVTGVSMAGFAGMQSTLTYFHSPPQFRSRVLGVLALCIGTGPIGFFNVGWMAETFGLPTALVVMSAEGLFVTLLLWLYGVLTRPEEEPTDDTPLNRDE